MSSPRLAVWMKDALQARLVEHALSHQVMDLIADQAAFARRVYDDVIDPGRQVRLEELPPGWVPEVHQLSVQFGDGGKTMVQLDFSGRTYINGAVSQALSHGDSESIKNVYRRVPYRLKDNVAKVYEVGHELQRDWEELCQRRVEIGTKSSDAQKIIRATLDSFSTVNSLINGWPEVEPFAARYRAAPPTQLPAIPRAALNLLLDLPAEEHAS